MEETKKENRFTDEQFKKIKEAVDKWMADYHCEICKNRYWIIDKYMVNLPVTNSLTVSLSGSILPLLPLTCTQCGNTHLINLSVIGLLDVIKNKED